jgi:hypothetical protein
MREITIRDPADGSSHGIIERNRRQHQRLVDAVTAARDGEPTALMIDGTWAGVLIPAADYHDPGKCCCKNCPWGNDHGPV